MRFDGLYASGLRWYWNANFVNHLSGEATALHVQHASQLPTMHSTMHLNTVNGAVHRTGEEDTAFSYRNAKWAEVIVGVGSGSGKQRNV